MNINKVKKEIFINVNPKETRVALRENGKLAEIFWEKEDKGRLVGSVYKGKVVKVIPGIQAAFIDIGLERNAYLSLADVTSFPEEDSLSDEEIKGFNEGIQERGTIHHKAKSDEKALKQGQEILVQVSKESMGQKGVRVTTHISFPGRYLVFTPTEDHIGISRKIENEKERDRLKKILEEIKPQGKGVIIRTVGEKRRKQDFLRDIHFLSRIWDKVQSVSDSVRAPYLLHQDLGLIFRIIRDLMSFDVRKLVIDSKTEYEEILDFLRFIHPGLKSRVELYQGIEPLFSFYGIEEEIYQALSRRVKLKCGGHIVIDETEALVAIDINTGKFVGRKNLEETVLKTNLEAAVEIPRQIRLRDMGGIIIVDFIDMEKAENRNKVLSTFREALAGDRSRTNVITFSKLGLVEMTRQRTRPSLEKLLCEPCPNCNGEGFVKSVSIIAREILNKIKKKKYDNTKRILVKTNTQVALYLLREAMPVIKSLEKLLGVDIFIKADKEMHIEKFETIAEKEVIPDENRSY